MRPFIPNLRIDRHLFFFRQVLNGFDFLGSHANVVRVLTIELTDQPGTVNKQLPKPVGCGQQLLVRGAGKPRLQFLTGNTLIRCGKRPHRHLRQLVHRL
ncbi:hypothetical protein D3C81_1661720 [compost metagenome]